jgi:tetratricopeptide (TPR) repeat protein
VKREAAERTIRMTVDSPDLQSEAFSLFAGVHAEIGNLAIASLAAKHSAQLARGYGAVTEGRAEIQRGKSHWHHGEFTEARAAFSSALRLLDRADDAPNVNVAFGNMGHCLASMGRHRDALVWFDSALRLAREGGRSYHQVMWLAGASHAHLAMRDYETADALARECHRVALAQEYWRYLVEAEWLRYKVARSWRPGASDRHRLAHIRRLSVFLESGLGDPVQKQVLEALEQTRDS